MANGIRLVVVDDHTVVRQAMKELLKEASFNIVGEAHDGEEAVALCRQLLPDIVLMDLNMPGIGGLEATRKILRASPETQILVLTVREDVVISKRALQAGAAGYLTKHADIAEIKRAIRLVHSGQRYISPALATEIAIHGIDQKDENPFDELSERELQVALMVTRGDKTPHIATQLCLSSKTVNSYRYRIFDKLGVQNDVELTHRAIQYGLLADLGAAAHVEVATEKMQ